MVHAQVKVGRADGPHAPVRLAAEGCLLVRRRCGDNELVAVHVGRLGCHRGERRAVGALLFNLRNLLPLQRRRGDLGAEDDVPDLRLREGGDVHVILLRVIPEDEVLEGDLDLDPLLVRGIDASPSPPWKSTTAVLVPAAASSTPGLTFADARAAPAPPSP